jgi:hypothetical protein
VGEEEAQVSAPAAEVHYDDSLPATGQLYHRYGQALQLLALAFQPEGQYIANKLEYGIQLPSVLTWDT